MSKRIKDDDLSVVITNYPDNMGNPTIKESLKQQGFNCTVKVQYGKNRSLGRAVVSFNNHEQKNDFYKKLCKDEVKISGKVIREYNQHTSKKFYNNITPPPKPTIKPISQIKVSPSIVNKPVAVANGAWLKSSLRKLSDLLTHEYVCIEFSVACSFMDNYKKVIQYRACEIGCVRFSIDSSEEGGIIERVTQNINPLVPLEHKQNEEQQKKIHGIDGEYGDNDQANFIYYEKTCKNFFKLLNSVSPIFTSTYVVFSQDPEITVGCLNWLKSETKTIEWPNIEVCDIIELGNFYFEQFVQNKSTEQNLPEFILKDHFFTENLREDKSGQCEYHKNKDAYFTCALRKARLSASFIRKICLDAAVNMSNFIIKGNWEEWNKILEVKEETENNENRATDILMLQQKPKYDLFGYQIKYKELEEKYKIISQQPLENLCILQSLRDEIDNLNNFNEQLQEKNTTLIENCDNKQLQINQLESMILSTKARNNIDDSYNHSQLIQIYHQDKQNMNNAMSNLEKQNIVLQQQLLLLTTEKNHLVEELHRYSRFLNQRQETLQAHRLEEENKYLRSEHRRLKGEVEKIERENINNQKEIAKHKLEANQATSHLKAIQDKMKEDILKFERNISSKDVNSDEKLKREMEKNANLEFKNCEMEINKQELNNTIRSLQQKIVNLKEENKQLASRPLRDEIYKGTLTKAQEIVKSENKKRLKILNGLRMLVQENCQPKLTVIAPNLLVIRREPKLHPSYRPPYGLKKPTVVGDFEGSRLNELNCSVSKFLSLPEKDLQMKVALFTVPNDDKRKALRGQHSVKAIRPIEKNEVFAEYIGVLMTQKQWNDEHTDPIQFAIEQKYLFSILDSIPTDTSDMTIEEEKCARDKELIIHAYGDMNATGFINDCRLNPFHTNVSKQEINYKQPNVLAIEYQTKREGQYRLFLIALRDIKDGEELLLDYGKEYWSSIREGELLLQRFNGIIDQIHRIASEKH